MTDEEMDTQLRHAASAEAMPAFSTVRHEQVMARVCNYQTDRYPRGITWLQRSMLISASSAAIVAIVIGLMWVTRAPAPAPVAQGPQVVPPSVATTSISVPDDFIARGALRAQDRIGAFVESSQLASLDEDATRLTQFVVDQLVAAAPSKVEQR